MNEFLKSSAETMSPDESYHAEIEAMREEIGEVHKRIEQLLLSIDDNIGKMISREITTTELNEMNGPLEKELDRLQLRLRELIRKRTLEVGKKYANGTT